jgi:hypothetical protein
MPTFPEILKKVTAYLASLIMFITSIFPGLLPKSVTPTPLDGRDYTDGDLMVQADTSKYLSVTVLDAGKNIYVPPEDSVGYRYGPSMFVNADGSIDAWFAAPGAKGEWDWITYRHSPDGGVTWTNEVRAVYPTPDSMDLYSTCDPGAVKFGGYYYIGYTSTIYKEGICNNVFVARSKTPQGPYEKWNGTCWGGAPKPLIYFDENQKCWGAGEPSFVVVGKTLFIYYTWTSMDANGNSINQTRVATADAGNENWPATLVYKGIAIDKSGIPGSDSADVKFVDDYGKFIAVFTSERLGPDSYISVYESNDGHTFTNVNNLKTDICYYCHNAGLSSRPNGHIRLKDNKYIAYAYGPQWGVWATRMQAINISLVDEKDFSDAGKTNSKTDVIPVKQKLVPTFIALTTSPHFFERKVSQGSFIISYFLVTDQLKDPRLILRGEKIEYSGYDSKIISMNGQLCTPLSPGKTYVTASYDGLSITFLVYVRNENEPINAQSPSVKAWSPVQNEYTIRSAANEQKQIRGLAVYEDNTWFELFSAADGVTYSGYDAGLINISPEGLVTKAGTGKGSTQVTASCNGMSFTVTVNVV